MNLSEWSAEVRVRDGRCLDCGSVDDLHAHHIKPKATHPELRLDLSNGKTLCYRCHKAAHDKQPKSSRQRGPQRKTLQARIQELEAAVKDMESTIRQLELQIKDREPDKTNHRANNHQCGAVSMLRQFGYFGRIPS